MKFNKYRSFIIAGALASMFACKAEVDDLEVTSGKAADGTVLNFDTYVALGNSLTAGYTDGAWVGAAQVNSYPRLIAHSLQSAGMGAKGFTQPLVTNSGSQYFGAQMELVNGGGLDIVINDPISAEGKRASSEITAGQYHNMAVPGIRAVDMAVAGYGNLNSMFGYFSSEANATVIGDAMAANPTFFSMWLGANDVLGFATSGGSMGSNDIMQATAITPQPVYEAAIEGVLDGMMSNGAKGVILNIPNIMDAPLFNVIPSTLKGLLELQGLPLDQNTLDLVNGYLAGAFDPMIAAGVEAQLKPTLVSILSPIEDLGGINTVAVAVGLIQQEQMDPTYVPTSLEVATKIVYLGAFNEAKAGGADDTMANSIANGYVASEQGQADIANLVAIGIDATWATYTLDHVQPILDQVTVGTIAQYKAAGYYPVFSMENNQMPIYDPNSPTMMIQTKTGAKFTLTAQGKVEELLGLILVGGDLDLANIQDYLPVASKGEALKATDVEDVIEAIEGYNTYLQAEATERDLAFLDTKLLLEKVADTGIKVSYTFFTNDYITGNLFSLDGAHLTQKGYAVIGKYTIDEINLHYNSTIPTIETDLYPAVVTQPVVPETAAAN